MSIIDDYADDGHMSTGSLHKPHVVVFSCLSQILLFPYCYCICTRDLLDDRFNRQHTLHCLD